MPDRASEFLYEHGGHIRESLIMLEGDDGAFQLLDHCTLPRTATDEEILMTAVRSSNTDCLYLLVQETPPAHEHAPRWHVVDESAMMALRRRLAGMRAEHKVIHDMLEPGWTPAESAR